MNIGYFLSNSAVMRLTLLVLVLQAPAFSFKSSSQAGDEHSVWRAAETQVSWVVTLEMVRK